MLACALLPWCCPALASADPGEQFARSCVLCHVTGEAGAPRVGDAAAWAPRIAQGEDVLLRHTLEGLRSMPPLGYCQDCEVEDFRALVRLLAPGLAPDAEAHE